MNDFDAAPEYWTAVRARLPPDADPDLVARVDEELRRSQVQPVDVPERPRKLIPPRDWFATVPPDGPPKVCQSLQGRWAAGIDAKAAALVRHRTLLFPDSIGYNPRPYALLGFDLRLMSWGDGSGVPTSGRNLVIVGTDDKGRLHIRIFDGRGQRVTDTDETQLPDQAAAIGRLKDRISAMLPPTVPTDAELAEVLGKATSIAGQTPLVYALLTGDGKTLVREDLQSYPPKTLVIASGTFLVNGSLLNRARRPLAEKVVEWVGQRPRRVAFVEGPFVLAGAERMKSPLELLWVEPLVVSQDY
jgi:hypothetical protein